MVSHDVVIFSGHWSSEGGDIKFLICHMTSQNCSAEESCNLVSRIPPLYVITPPSFVAIGVVVVKICFYFVT